MFFKMFCTKYIVKHNIGRFQNHTLIIIGESSLVGQGITFRIGRFPVPTRLVAWSGFGTQPCYKALGDLQVEIYKKHSGFPLDSGPKLVMGQPSSRKKNHIS